MNTRACVAYQCRSNCDDMQISCAQSPVTGRIFTVDVEERGGHDGDSLKPAGSSGAFRVGETPHIRQNMKGSAL